MLIDAPGIRSRLHGIVNSLVPPPLREDLMQEAMVHLWRSEQQHPGNSDAWYLQGCRFYLQNYLRQGRSVDSWKHFWAQVLNWEQVQGDSSFFEQAESNGSLWDEASVNHFIGELSQWLTPPEKETLRCLMDGLSAREAARQLDISHTMVNRHRSQIASLALKLGVAPVRNRPERRP